MDTIAEENFRTASTPESKGEVLVRVENVSKKFCRSLKKSLWYGLQDAASELTGQKASNELRKDEFWAVKDVSFDLRRGECLGLVGPNGAGKSTLLKMLNGLIKPDIGQIKIHGQVGGLIALGAGFNPILTGKENIYVNGSVLGLSQAEVDAKLSEIIEFAEIGDFINAPVQTYSSGMQVRLGFAVAAVLIRPDVLLLDEVLAVGDIGFTIKCLNAMRELSRESAVIFVSHSMQFVSTFCNCIMVMKNGCSLVNTKAIGRGIDTYLELFTATENISGTGEAMIQSALLKCTETEASGTHNFPVAHNSHLEVEFELETCKLSNVRIQVDTQSLLPILTSTLSDKSGYPLTLDPGKHRVRFSLGLIELNSGHYSIVVGVLEKSTRVILCRHQGVASFRVINDKGMEWGHIVRQLIANVETLDVQPKTN